MDIMAGMKDYYMPLRPTFPKLWIVTNCAWSQHKALVGAIGDYFQVPLADPRTPYRSDLKQLLVCF